MLNASRRAIPSRCQAPIIEATSAITQSPISAMIPVCSAIGMKLLRHPHAVARMVPAQQRLGAGNLPGDEAQLRLQGEQEFAALDRFGQRILGFDLLPDARAPALR